MKAIFNSLIKKSKKKPPKELGVYCIRLFYSRVLITFMHNISYLGRAFWFLSQGRNRREITGCLTSLTRLFMKCVSEMWKSRVFGCTDVKMTFSFAVITSIAVIIPADNFLGRTSLIGNWLRELAEDFQKSFNLQNGDVLSNKFSSCFLILPRKWEDTN